MGKTEEVESNKRVSEAKTGEVSADGVQGCGCGVDESAVDESSTILPTPAGELPQHAADLPLHRAVEEGGGGWS